MTELGPAELHRASIYAALADYPYQVDTKGIHEATNDADAYPQGTWQLDRDLASSLATGSGLTYKDGCISNGNGGLMAYVFANSVANEVTIVFGGTSSTYAGGGAYNPSRLASGARHHFNQWVTNVQAVCGAAVPQSYADAVALVRVANISITDRRLSTCGHSLGGSLAAFAAAMNSTGEREVEAACFCAPPLGLPLVTALSARYPTVAQLANYAKQKILHFNVEGDPVPQLEDYLNASHIGTAYSIPATAVSGPKLVETAAYYLARSPIRGLFLHVDFFHQTVEAVRTERERHGLEATPRPLPFVSNKG